MNPWKLSLIAFWLLCLGSFFVATGSTTASLGRTAFWLMAAVHAIECAVFLPSLRKAGGPLASHLFQTFIFGYLHLKDVRGGPA